MKKAVQNGLFFKNVSCLGCFQTCSCASNVKAEPHTTKRFYSNVIGNTRKFGHVNAPVFKPEKVVILSRITRYEFEKIRYKDESEEQFKSKVSKATALYRLHLKCLITTLYMYIIS